MTLVRARENPSHKTQSYMSRRLSRFKGALRIPFSMGLDREGPAVAECSLAQSKLLEP